MPTYQYACPDCNTQFERAQRFTDPPISVCPECGSGNVYRVVGKVAVTFKGSGWYITDSRQSSGSGNKNGTSSDQTSSAETSATPEPAKSESHASSN